MVEKKRGNPCIICGDTTLRKRNRFCSSKCMSFWRIQQYKNNPEFRKQQVERLGKASIAHKIEWMRILKECENLKQQGFRVIPIGRKVIPDIIALKDNKVFAVEVEYNKPNYSKYTDEIRQFYDDIIWVIKRRWRDD